MRALVLTSVVLCSFLLGCAGSGLQPSPDELGPFASRQDFLKRLEPRGDRILHGAGANPQDFAEYWNELGRTPPLLYATHLDLMALREDWPLYVRAAIDRYPRMVIPQLGISMTWEGRPYEVDVARGELDQQIDLLCWGLAALDRPVFVRLGYGFNSPLTGYRPEPYRQAWVRVADSIRIRHGLRNVALVWGASADASLAGCMEYYPGDQWVDWWGLDLFDPRSTVAAETVDFLTAARERGYPVMIGEAAPRGLAVEPDSRAWERWFAPFFRFLRRHPNVKAFCYVSWRAGDTRVAGDLDLLQRYREEMSRDQYVHAADVETLRWVLQWEE